QFSRVDADTIDKLIQKDEEQPSLLSAEQIESLKPMIEGEVDKGKLVVQIESMSATDSPMIITQSEFMRRMKEQQMTGGGGMQMFGSLPDTYNLVVNGNHPLVSKILEEKDDAARSGLIKQTVDLALLAQGLLKGEDLTDFVSRSVEMIK
ncbi:MAG TPA: molecular chaperone HtpG, partial [Flavobacteriales bacterium]|nr:molecular chaperone HtpG [Flavobacteriales bacterium]